MQTVYMEGFPTCNFCNKLAKYDAPTKLGPWAYLCQECFNDHGIEYAAIKLEQRIPAEPEATALMQGKELNSLEEQIMTGDRSIACPRCESDNRVEPDAYYIYICEGCGMNVQVPAPFC